MDTEIILQGFINEARSELKRFQVVALVIAMDIEREDSVYTVMVTGNGPSVEELNQTLRSGYRLEASSESGPRGLTIARQAITFDLSELDQEPINIFQKIEQHEQLQVNEDL